PDSSRRLPDRLQERQVDAGHCRGGKGARAEARGPAPAPQRDTQEAARPPAPLAAARPAPLEREWMPGIPSRLAPWLVLFTALAVVLLSGPLTQQDKLRIAIDIAGDERLPGATPFPDWQTTRDFVERLGESQSRGAYLDFLHADDRSAAALLALFLSIGLITWRRVPH